MVVELTPVAGRPMMIVVNPFSQVSALQLVAENGGLIVAAGPTAWIAFGADAGDGGFRQRLVGSAALMILRGDAARLCHGRSSARSIDG